MAHSIIIIDPKDRQRLSGSATFARSRGAERLVQMLASFSISVGRAETVEEGVMLMDLLHPDLLLIDPSIPDGFDAIDYAAGHGIDVIAVTGSDAVLNHASKYGVHRSLVADDGWDTLLDAVLAFFGQNHAALSKNTGGRILVVDASDETDTVILPFLDGRGFSVSTASIGSECMAALVSDPSIEVVVLNSLLPDVSGMEILKTLSGWQSPPSVIMISALINSEIAQEARSLGALDYMIKPVNLHALETNILTCLVRSQHRTLPWWKRIAGGFIRTAPCS
jgi:DNA-binding response OmpR family regulator